MAHPFKRTNRRLGMSREAGGAAGMAGWYGRGEAPSQLEALLTVGRCKGVVDKDVVDSQE